MTGSRKQGPTGSRSAAHERVTEGLFALDDDWRFTYLDDEAQRLLDVTESDVVGQAAWETVPELADGSFKSHCLRARTRGEPTELEQLSPSLGQEIRMRIYPGDGGVTVRVHPVDGTVDAKATSELISTDPLTDAAVAVDTDGVIREANAGVEPLFGYEPEGLIGEPLSTVIPEWLAERHESGFDRYLQTGERELDWRNVELPGERKDGSEVPLSISFTDHGEEQEPRFTGVLRDVSEKKEREWALQQANEVFSAPDIDFDERVSRLLELGCAVLGTKYGVLSQIRGDEYLFDTVIAPEDAETEAGDTVPLEATNCERVVTTRESLVLDNVTRDAPELAARAGNAEWGISCYLGVPVVIDDDAVGTFCFYDMAPRTEPFTEWQVTFIEHLGQWISQTLEQRRQVEQLRALNEINRVVHEVADASIEKSTREEIERRVCEALAATNSYLFAWIGQPNPQTQTVDPRAEAGVENYLDDVTITVDLESKESQGPTGKAIQTGEVQVLQRVDTAPEYEPWADIIDAYGFRSSAAIPIVHEGTNYGVLNIYTERPDAFEDQEREMVALLGKMVGHAIAAAARKQALLSESMVELELRTTGALDKLGIPGPAEPILLEAAVPRGEDEYLVFGKADPGDRTFVEQLVDIHSSWKGLVSVEETDDQFTFEVLLEDPPLLTTLASAGGQLSQAVIEGTDVRMKIQLPPQANVRKTLDAVRETYPSTSLISKQQVSAKRVTDSHGVEVALTDLTERQLESLRTAYYAGYFEWPREASGEEVAELLDISPPTFSQHLRGAEQTVFAALFEDQSGAY